MTMGMRPKSSIWLRRLTEVLAMRLSGGAHMVWTSIVAIISPGSWLLGMTCRKQKVRVGIAPPVDIGAWDMALENGVRMVQLIDLCNRTSKCDTSKCDTSKQPIGWHMCQRTKRFGVYSYSFWQNTRPYVWKLLFNQTLIWKNMLAMQIWVDN